MIFGTRDKNRTRKREFKGRARVGFWEAIISNFSVIGGRLFGEGDYCRDDYYSRKYSTGKVIEKIKKENKNKMVNYNCENKR